MLYVELPATFTLADRFEANGDTGMRSKGEYRKILLKARYGNAEKAIALIRPKV